MFYVYAGLIIAPLIIYILNYVFVGYRISQTWEAFLSLFETPFVSDEIECPDCSAKVELQGDGSHILDGFIPVCECNVEGCPFKNELDENKVYGDV